MPRMMKDPVLVYHDFNVMVMPESAVLWHVPVPAPLGAMRWIADEQLRPTYSYETYRIERYVHNRVWYHMVVADRNFLPDAIPFIRHTAGKAVSKFKLEQQLDVWTPIEIIWDIVSEDPNVSDLLYASVRLIAGQ